MNSEKLWDESLIGADYEKISDFAVEVPKVLSEASTGERDDVVRGAGLLLTKEEIVSIKKYVSIGFAFPTSLLEVEDFLRYGAGEDGGTGLKSSDFLSTFTRIREHADTWTPLRERIMITGTDLESFGASMRVWGRAMERFYDSDEAIQLIKKHNIKTYEDLKKLEYEWSGTFPGITLNPETVSGIGEYLKEIRDDIDQYQVRTNEIKNDLDVFGDTLEKKVIPDIKSRLTFVSGNKYPLEVELLNGRISDRAETIDKLNLEYKALVEKSLSSAATFNIVGLGMAIYIGVEAENVRAEKKKLNKEQEVDIQSLNVKNVTLGSLKRVEHDLQNCKIASLNAEMATNNLRHVWNVMNHYVNESVSRMAGIDDGLKLHKFMSTFSRVVVSWIKVENDAGELVRVFAEADKEYQGEVQMTRMATFKMSSLMGAQDYPALDLTVLSDSKKRMRADLARATALSENLQYLPDVNDRFGRLVNNVHDSARMLQTSADSSQRTLEDTREELKQLEKNLAREISRESDEDVIKEIIAERTEVLLLTRKVIVEQLSNIAKSHQSIVDDFDTSKTADVASRLRVDIDNALAHKEELGKKLTQYREEQDVIDSAVRSIENAGIEGIGKDINLTIDKINQLGLAPTEVKVIMLAIELIKKAIEDAAKNVSFIFMLQKSRELREKIASVQEKVVEQGSIVNVAEKKVEFINVIHEINGQHILFKTEYKNAINAFARFISVVEAGAADDNTEEERFLVEADAFTAFLLPVAQPNH